MTIRIGVVCNRAEHVILCADMRTTIETGAEPIYNDLAGKIYEVSPNCCACTADSMNWTHSVGSALHYRVSKTLPCDINLDVILEALQAADEGVRRRYLNYKLRPTGITLNDYVLKRKRIRREILDDAKGIIATARLPVEMIIGGYAGRPILLRYTGRDGLILEPSGGTALFAIGTGATLALRTLSNRSQNIYTSLQRSFFHVCEAKVASEKAPGKTVGPNTQFVIVSSTGWHGINGISAGKWYDDRRDIKNSAELDTEAERECFKQSVFHT